jgi:acyl-CoA thioesterase-1
VASLAQYARNLQSLIARLRHTGAELIFATTTPVPAGAQGRVSGDEIAYNATAARLMSAAGITVSDLHAVASPRIADIQLPRNVHFTPEGYRVLGEAVAASVRSALTRRRDARAVSSR